MKEAIQSKGEGVVSEAALKINKLVHDQCKDVPHDIGLQIINLIEPFLEQRSKEFAEWVKNERWQSMPEESWFKRYSDRPTESKSTEELFQLFLTDLNKESK